MISVWGDCNIFTLSVAVWADGSQPYALGGEKFASNLRDVSLYRSSFFSGYFLLGIYERVENWFLLPWL